MKSSAILLAAIKRDFRRWQFWVPLVAAVGVALMLPVWMFLSVQVMLAEPRGIAIAVIGCLLVGAALASIVWIPFHLVAAMKERKKYPGQLGPPMSIIPHVALVVSLQLAIGPVVVWTIKAQENPTRSDWERVSRELPALVRAKMFGLD